MKNLILIIFIFLHCSLFSLHAFSQPCLPDGITFYSQEDIDDFQITYPNCTEIEGDVEIDGYYINNLNGINVLTSIEGSLLIRNTILTSLTGLENLISIGGKLDIGNNDALTNLLGLENLTSIGEMLNIWSNDALTSLTGLESLEAGSICNLDIDYNNSLSDCNVQSICDYLAAPNGIIEIHSNATGCNNPSEVAVFCGITLPCLPSGNYYFYTQSQIDNFQTNYPNCTQLEGDVVIRGDDITNLNGLNVVTAIGGNMAIKQNDLLTSLTGLDNLYSIEGNLTIGPPFSLFGGSGYGNPSLTTLTGLEGLTSIGGNLKIGDNDALVSLTGLENLTSVEGVIVIGYVKSQGSIAANPLLTCLTGLEGLTSIGGGLGINHNEVLCNLTGLDYLTSIGGGLGIGQNALTSLTELENLTSIGGGLTIEESALTSLTGLENLTSIGGDLSILGDSLTSFTGLENLTTIGGNFGSFEIPSFTGLENLVSIGGDFSVLDNWILHTNFIGFDNLASIGGDLTINDNYFLTNFIGLDNLNSIGGSLYLENTVLSSLEGLDNLTSISGDLSIIENWELSTCDVQSICDYLAAPNGTIEIYNNGPGCDSQEEVEDACNNVSIQESNFDDSFTLSPNPMKATTKVQYKLSQNSNVIIKILDVNGKEITTLINNEVQQQGEQEVIFRCTELPAGVYVCKLKTTHFTTTTKIIKLN